MFHKSQTMIKSDEKPPKLQKISLKQTRKAKILKSPLNYTKKKFSPRINSSFAEYDEILSPKIRFRSTSVDRPRRASEIPISSSINSSTLEDHAFFILVSAKKDFQEGRYTQSIQKFSQVLSFIDNIEALYSRAIAYIKQNNYKEGIIDLLNVIKENSLYCKKGYLQLCTCFQACGDLDAGLRYISQGIQRFSRFDEGFLARGKLYTAKRNWEKARLDYKKYLKHHPESQEAIVGLSATFEAQGDYTAALKILEESSSTGLILQTKGKLYFALRDYSLALASIDASLQTLPSAESYYLKAQCHIKQNQYTEAGLSFEQSIKYDVDNELTPRSILHLGAIKIFEKDFYGALHTFQRCSKNKTRDQKVLELYAEAVISLMKKEYTEGIKVFSKLIKSKESVIEEYIGSCYCYRAYGYLATSLFEKALQSLKKAGKYKALDKASLYNQELAFALFYATKLDFSSSRARLDSASKIFPRKTEPYIYKAAILIQEAFKDDKYRLKDILQAENLIETAALIREPDSELLFYRSIIKYFNTNPQQGLEDMKQCIEKAEDNISEHYILRGLCYASLKSYKEAIQDFTIALQLNDKHDEVYSYRGRCGYMIDDTSLAFSDFQKFVLHNKDDYKVHIQAGVLLMSAGSYEDALRALENSMSLSYSVKANYLIAKCYVIQTDIQSAIRELKKIIKHEALGTAKADLEILSYLNSFSSSNDNFVEGIQRWDTWSKGFQGDIFDLKYILWFKAVFCVFSGRFSEALEVFQLVLEILHSKDSKSMNPDETLTSEEENCEILYNISLCHLFNNKAQSILILEDLSEILNNKHKGQMLLLIAIVHLTLNNNSVAAKVLKEAFRCDPETVTPFLAKCPVKLLPLNTNSSFTERFPLISLNFPNQPKIEVRPAVSLPRIPLPSLEFTVQTEVKEFFALKKITPKPEAPWLNRIKGSIQFTETIVDIDTEPTEITDRPSKEEAQEDYVFSKREIKSMIPLKHYFSESIQEINNEIEDTPYDIVKKIHEICNSK